MKDEKVVETVRKKAEQLASTNDYEEYFTQLLDMNITCLTGYYELAEEQTSKSFWLTACTAVGGFLILAGGIILSFIPVGETSVAVDSVAIASGLIVQFIAGVMFYLYNETAKQLNLYHDKLLRVQDLILALKLTQSIEDEKIKNGNLEYLAKSIVTYQTKEPGPEDTSGTNAKDSEITGNGRATRNGHGGASAEHLSDGAGNRGSFRRIFRKKPVADRVD